MNNQTDYKYETKTREPILITLPAGTPPPTQVLVDQLRSSEDTSLRRKKRDRT